MRRRLACLAPLALVACGSDPETAPAADTPYVAPPSSAVVEDAAVKIRREVFLVPGATPPPNPVTGDATPAELDYVRVVRYRVDADPPLPARAVAVLVPGFLGGAGSYDPMARAIVRRSTDGAAYEAWAVDRRANLLEDHHGLDVAEARRDPEIALRYYFEEEPAEGKVFGGFLDHALVPYMSEWGLATTLGDLRAVIGLVDEADRKARVVLVGHSLGASIVEEYAAWDFDGARGHDELAGLVLIDGVARVEGAAEPSITEEEYTEGVDAGVAGFTAPGLDTIRSSTRFIALPFLGLKVYPTTAITAMRSLWSPDAIATDPYRDSVFATLLSVPQVPKMTNRAAMGLGFDDESNGVSFAAVSCGRSTGGPMEEYESLLGSTLKHPTDAAAVYDWQEYDEVAPAEHTALDDLARSWFEGPELDFAEWYFPARLSLDVQAAATLVLEPGMFPYDDHDLRAVHGRTMDMPIFAAVAGLVGTTSALDSLRALVADVPIGPGRPLAGTARTDERAFHVLDVHELTHIDPLTGADRGSPLVTGWYDGLVDWMAVNTPEGGVAIAVQPSGR
jgi:pimeloyl-ACP methyl ester carboxylesterase